MKIWNIYISLQLSYYSLCLCLYLLKSKFKVRYSFCILHSYGVLLLGFLFELRTKERVSLLRNVVRGPRVRNVLEQIPFSVDRRSFTNFNFMRWGYFEGYPVREEGLNWSQIICGNKLSRVYYNRSTSVIGEGIS